MAHVRTSSRWIDLAARVALAAAALFPPAGCSGSDSPAAEPDAGPTREGLPIATPAEVGFDAAAVDRLEADATRYQTDALLVIKDGKLVIEDYFGGADQEMITMSAAKSFVSLAVGFLVQEGKLSVSQRASDFITEWKDDPDLSQITIQHLLTQTSGLDPTRAMDPDTFEALPLRAWLVEQPIDYAPGAIWIYNNNAVDALALIAQLAAGEDLDAYLARVLFDPLDTTAGEFMRFPDGAPMGAGELIVRPLAMAKVGLLLADGGVAPSGDPLIDPGWIETSAAPSTSFAPEYGLLWWRNVPIEAIGFTQDILDYWASKDMSQGLLDKMATLVGREFASWSDYRDAVLDLLTTAQIAEIDTRFSEIPHLPIYRALRVGTMRGFMANGWMGQFLFVDPEEHLVAVRMHLPTEADYGPTPPDTEFREFPDDVLALLGASSPR